MVSLVQVVFVTVSVKTHIVRASMHIEIEVLKLFVKLLATENICKV